MTRRKLGASSVSLVARLYLLVALAVLPAIAIQGYNELELRRERDGQVHAEALRLAEFAASELDGRLSEARTLLLSLARSSSIQEGDADVCGRLLTDLGRDLVDYTGLGAIDLAGRSRCSQPEPLIGGEWRRSAAGGLKDGFHVGSFTSGTAGGPGFLPITLPFEDGDGARCRAGRAEPRSRPAQPAIGGPPHPRGAAFGDRGSRRDVLRSHPGPESGR